MSDFSTDFFELDDDDSTYDGGGFDGFDAFLDTPTEDKPEDKPEVTDKPLEEKPADQAPATPTPADNSAHLIGVIAKQTEHINTLLEASKTKEPDPEPPAKPEFTQAEWEDNPAQCTQAMYEYNRDVDAKSEAERTAQANAQRQKQVGKIQAAHNEGWKAVLEAVPALNTNENTPLRSLYAQHFSKVNGDPMGTIKAMNALKNDPRAKAFLTPANAPAKAEPKPPGQTAQSIEAARAKGAADEKARQSRVQSGVMHGSGKGGGQQKIALTPAQRSAAHQFGVSEESYAASLKAMGGEI